MPKINDFEMEHNYNLIVSRYSNNRNRNQHSNLRDKTLDEVLEVIQEAVKNFPKGESDLTITDKVLELRLRVL